MVAESPLCTLRISIADMMHLRVRARGPGQGALPEFLYQALPMDALSIMGTIPRGTSAVSIPHRSILNFGYEIVQTAPSENGFVIVYARQPNSRYEAAHVLLKGETISVADFHERACQWINDQKGGLKTIPGRYAYFAPSRDHWAVILRDNGYTVLDPSRLPNTITRDLRKCAKNQVSQILARIPVYAGQNRPQDATLPVFARVELKLDLHPSARSAWISFIEYQRARDSRSLPPPSIIPDFLEWLKILTAQCGFNRWVFEPGMLFGDRIEWWGDQNRRRTEHEGVDFAEGLRTGSTMRSIPELTPVYAIADGNVVAVLDDFLGKTVVTCHPQIAHESGYIFYTFLGHIQPVSEKLESVAKGRLLGRVCKSANASVPAHLHLTGAWIPYTIHPGTITLDHIHPANTSAVLVNFNKLIKSKP